MRSDDEVAPQRITPELRVLHAPQSLRDKKLWLCWAFERFEGEDKPRKVPYYPSGPKRHGVQGGPEDRGRLTTFAKAKDAAIRRGMSGVGFAPMDDACVIALDFDNCVAGGKVDPKVLDLVEGTYAEYSPSGTGVRALYRGDHALLGNRKSLPKDGRFGVEAFSSRGFVTMTGDMLGHVDLLGYKDRVAQIPQHVIDFCLERFGEGKAPEPSKTGDAGIDALLTHKPKHGASEQEMTALLDKIDPDCTREEWISVGMGLHHETDGDEVGFALWNDWSSLGVKYPSEEALRAQWESFERPRPSNASAVTLGTVKSLAKQAGYSGKFPDYAEDGKARTRSSVFRFTQVADLKYRPPEFLIEGLIEAGCVGLVFGDPACGKSFLAVDIAMSVATGTWFHGRTTKPGPVFFIAGEGHNGLSRRFEAWKRDRGVCTDKAPLFVSSQPAQFLDKTSASSVEAAVKKLVEQHGEPQLIIIDTLARNFGPGDENSTAEMGAFIAAIDDMRAPFTACTVLIVHHTGHMDKQRARGSMALKAALDFEYRVERKDRVIKIINTKMKDAEPPSDMAFELNRVDLEYNASSAVLVETVARESARKLTPVQETARQALVRASATHGHFDEDTFEMVDVKHWKNEFVSMHTAPRSDDSRRKAFQRASKVMKEAGLVSIHGGAVTVTCSKLFADILSERTRRTCPDK